MHPATGEIIAECNTELTVDVMAKIVKAQVVRFETLYTNDIDCGPFISDTLKIDSTTNQLEALVEIYRMMRPASRQPRRRRDAVQQPVLRCRALRPVGCRPDEVQPPYRSYRDRGLRRTEP